MKTISIYSLHVIIAVLTLTGCNTRMGGGTVPAGNNKPLFSQAQEGGEEWTIRCAHSDSPNHAQDLGTLAEMLKRVQGLQAKNVRLVTSASESTLYYGQYTKVPSPKTGRLVFPPEYQQDIELIRRLAVNQRTPFFYAEPELMNKTSVTQRGEWDISTAKGVYTLQIAVFYNTPAFTEREKAATEYVRLLRENGYNAYYRHEQLRSYVFVGDFDESDVFVTGGVPKLGPKVEQFIARNEAEFRYISENGQLVKRNMPDGRFSAPFSYLVPVPRGPKTEQKK